MSALRDYCNARAGRAFGWKARYEAGKHHAWLAGHYNMMLDELLDLLGPAKVAAAIDALAALDAGCPCCGAHLDGSRDNEAVVEDRGARLRALMAEWDAAPMTDEEASMMDDVLRSLQRCDQCGVRRADWQDVDAVRCPNHANPLGSCDGKLTP